MRETIKERQRDRNNRQKEGRCDNRDREWQEEKRNREITQKERKRTEGDRKREGHTQREKTQKYRQMKCIELTTESVRKSHIISCILCSHLRTFDIERNKDDLSNLSKKFVLAMFYISILS